MNKTMNGDNETIRQKDNGDNRKVEKKRKTPL